MHSVKTQALQSESAVIEITRDMKRLDYAKRHLQRTITALKRLHMLLHAAEQLRMAATIDEEQAGGSPIPNYKAASQLIDATRLLLGHFDGYMNSVPKMRQVRDAIGMLNTQLREGVVNLFKEVGFQQQQQQQQQQSGNGYEEEEVEEETTAPMVVSALSDACLVIDALGEQSKEDFVKEFISDHLEEYEKLYSPFPVKKNKKGNTSSNKGGGGRGSNSKSLSSSSAPGSPSKSFKKSSTSMASSQSGGDATNSNDPTSKPSSSSSSNSNNNPNSPSSLDQVEQRFAWYRSKLRSLQLKFTNVFPLHWNLYYHLTVSFLERTARHLKFVLRKHAATVRIAPFNPNAKEGGGDSSTSMATPSMVMSASAVTQAASKFGMSVNSSAYGDGSGGGGSAADGLSDGEKAVTALLKALQKTILFEKEMSAWLSRDFGTQFVDPSEVVVANDAKKKKKQGGEEEGGEEEALEFDDQGRAVAAGSAEGIRIKYERRKRMGGGFFYFDGNTFHGYECKCSNTGGI